MKSVSFVCAIAGAATLAPIADAGFMGFVAFTRTSGAYTVIDVFCAVSNASDKFLNVYDAEITTTVAGGFYQRDTADTRGWRPDGSGSTSTRASIDSFMTAGSLRVAGYPGVYAGSTTTADPNFTSSAWTGIGLAANGVPSLAGWYTNNPPSEQNMTESLTGLTGRRNSGATAGAGATGPTVGSQGAAWGIWCSHMVLSGTQPVVFGPSGNVQFHASASIKDGVTGVTTQGVSTIPAPGAIAMLAAAARLGRRRRTSSTTDRSSVMNTKNTLLCATLGTAALAAPASAGFMGFVASVREIGGFRVVDVFAAVSNSSDRFLNVYDATISTTVAGGFFQGSSELNKAWRPDTTNWTSTRNAIDSFMTAGGTNYLLPAGAYSSETTAGDPNFTGSSWTPTAISAPANTVPALAGWYTNDPTADTNATEGLAGLPGRVNGSGAAGAQFGIWCSHLVLQSTAPITFGANGNLRYGAFASIKDGVTGVTTQGFSVIPGPGAVAVLGLAGIAASRRRRA